MKPKQISIKWKIYLYLVGFCFLLLMMLWLFQTVLLDSFYKTIKAAQVKNVAQTISGYITESNWDGLLAMLTDHDDLYVEVLSPSLETMLVAGSNVSSNIKSQYRPKEKAVLFSQASQTGDAIVKRFPPAGSSESESILYVKLLPTAQENRLLMVSANISPVDATVQTLQIQLTCISVIMIALAAALALLISNRVSRPIERLGRSARELAAGNYQVAFDGRGYQEIADLADILDQAARELAKTDSLRRELIANVSHDLRTPLTLITGYSEMIQELPGENVPENMQVIIDESKRLTSLVNDLLDLSRLQSGNQPLNPTRFNLTDEIEGILGRFTHFCQQDGYQIDFVHSGSCWVAADCDRIGQVIYNFMTNAITHTGPDKRITLTQLLENGRVKVSVTDTGEGIPEESLPYVWERYYKVDSVHKRMATGTGLGLSIVKAILSQHPDVEYGVVSSPGQGSTFWFSLPCEDGGFI
ncbi:HAMP domain-containing sensor histidine kinase [Oscillospiraceae bacterium MB08-C2-2]|nr:HAMP domain-containing sensor histidine kinase [Oscillospiraceae bacterium MB08-C2-2]